MMGWYRTRTGLVHADGGLAQVYVDRGCELVDDDAAAAELAGSPAPSGRSYDDGDDPGPQLTVTHQVHADLTDDEQADVDTAVRDEA